MHRLIIFISFYLCCSLIAKSQQIDYNYIDSLSYAQYINGAWDNLILTGKIAEKAHISFPNLSMRIGYAAHKKGNFSLSLKHYNRALTFNSFNQDALYYVVLNNKLLSRREVASFNSKNIAAEIQKTLGIHTKKFAEQVDVEMSFKPTNTEIRKTGQYYRIGLGNRINYRWKIYHSFISYRQNLLAPDTTRIIQRPGNGRPAASFRTFMVNDFQYYLKSEVMLRSDLSLINAFHYIKTNFDNATFNTSIFNISLKYLRPFADFKIELNAGPMLDSLLTQVAVSSTYFPSGNLNFYANSRLSYQRRVSVTQLNYSQLFGIKLSNALWIETHATLGEIKNLIDNESLYIYDAMDAGNFRIGASIILPLRPKFTVLTNYYYEQKKLHLQNTNYNLHSFSIGLSWKL